MHHVSLFLGNNSYIRVLWVDFSNAFDIVDHGILLPKLVVILFKYADDTHLIVPENTSVCLLEEYVNIKECARKTKMIINILKA